VVEEGGGEGGLDLVGRHDGALLAEGVEGGLHQRHRAEGVLEPGVDGAGEDEEAEAELADPPQPLERRRLDERQDQPLRDADEAVDGVVEELEAARHAGGGRARRGGRGRNYLTRAPCTRHVPPRSAPRPWPPTRTPPTSRSSRRRRPRSPTRSSASAPGSSTASSACWP